MRTCTKYIYQHDKYLTSCFIFDVQNMHSFDNVTIGRGRRFFWWNPDFSHSAMNAHIIYNRRQIEGNIKAHEKKLVHVIHLSPDYSLQVKFLFFIFLVIAPRFAKYEQFRKFWITYDFRNKWNTWRAIFFRKGNWLQHEEIFFEAG